MVKRVRSYQSRFPLLVAIHCFDDTDRLAANTQVEILEYAYFVSSHVRLAVLIWRSGTFFDTYTDDLPRKKPGHRSPIRGLAHSFNDSQEQRFPLLDTSHFACDVLNANRLASSCPWSLSSGSSAIFMIVTSRSQVFLTAK